MEIRTFTGPQKAAILMMSLGEELAVQMFDQLEEEEAEVISAYMARVGKVSPDEIDRVLMEFTQITQGDNYLPLIAGRDAIRKFLIKSLGEKKAATILKEMEMGEKIRSKRGKLLSVQAMDPTMVATLVTGEHPQVISLVIAHMEPEGASEVLAKLPLPVQLEVIQRVSTLARINPEMLNELDDVLHDKMKAAGATISESVGGLEAVVEMLSQADRTLQENILREMERVDEALADKINTLLFTFEDLLLLDDRSMQILLKDVKGNVLVTSLKSASPDLEQFVYRNMSERQAAMIQEDLEALGAVKLKDVEQAQSEVVRSAKRLEEEGRIVIGGRGEAEVVV